jgi:hypothetical protein
MLSILLLVDSLKSQKKEKEAESKYSISLGRKIGAEVFVIILILYLIYASSTYFKTTVSLFDFFADIFLIAIFIVIIYLILKVKR